MKIAEFLNLSIDGKYWRVNCCACEVRVRSSSDSSGDFIKKLETAGWKCDEEDNGMLCPKCVR